MQLDPSLNQAELLARKIASKHLTIINADGSFKFGILGMYMRSFMMLILYQV